MKKKLLLSALAFVLAINMCACGMTSRTDLTTDTNTSTNRSTGDRTVTDRMDGTDRDATTGRYDNARDYSRGNDMTPDFNDGYVKDNHADDGVVDDRAGRHLYNAELMR